MNRSTAELLLQSANRCCACDPAIAYDAALRQYGVGVMAS